MITVNKMTLAAGLTATLLMLAATASAGPDAFGPGPVIKSAGRIADVPNAVLIPAEGEIKFSYDAVDGGVQGEINKVFSAAAGFLNVFVANGVEKERVKLAIVIHGTAYKDVLTDKAYGGINPNGKLVKELLDNGVKFYFCGQAAVYRDVAQEDLIPGIELSLSASAAHAVLQMQGYGVRPY